MVTRSYESVLTLLATGSITLREANRALRIPRSELQKNRRELIATAQRKLRERFAVHAG